MSDNVRSTWRMDDDRKKRWRITDDALSKTIATKLEMRLDRKVHHQLVLVSSGYLPQMTTVQFRKLMNNSEKLLIQAMQAELKEGMSVQLSFMMPSLELEVTEAKKKAFKAKYKGKKVSLIGFASGIASLTRSEISRVRGVRCSESHRGGEERSVHAGSTKRVAGEGQPHQISPGIRGKFALSVPNSI